MHPEIQMIDGQVGPDVPHLLLEVPEGLQANIFQRPDGDYLVPLIAPRRTMASGAENVPVHVKVRVPDAGTVKGVYARAPETPGQQFAVPWTMGQGTLEITLPWLGSAALVWISKTEQPRQPVPAPPPDPKAAKAAPSSPVMAASISCAGIVPTGAVLRVKTTAPIPPPPVRKCSLNGHPIGMVSSRNYRGWHGGVGIGVPDTVLTFLKKENELVIEPAGPQDFIAVRNLVLTIALADGRTISSEPVRQTYCSCESPLATGIIGAPIRIPIHMPNLEEILASKPAKAP
jgi:hypothetical protein